MNRPAILAGFLTFCLLLGTGVVWAADPMASGAAGGGTAAFDKNHLEGWIIGVDYRGNNFRLLDGRGFQKRVVTKPGTIGDFRLGDRVRVEIDPGYKRANSIEKLYT